VRKINFPARGVFSQRKAEAKQCVDAFFVKKRILRHKNVFRMAVPSY